MLYDAQGRPIGQNPDDAAAMAVQTIAAKARDVLAALDMIGVQVPLPVEIRAGTQVATLGKDGVKVEAKKRERAPKVLAAPAAPAVSAPCVACGGTKVNSKGATCPVCAAPAPPVPAAAGSDILGRLRKGKSEPTSVTPDPLLDAVKNKDAGSVAAGVLAGLGQ